VLADGSTEKIGKIVNQRMPVEVLSYDPATGRVEPRRVVNWFDNGPTNHFLRFEIEGGASGPRSFSVTPNHVIFSPSGPVHAAELSEGDEVLVAVNEESPEERTSEGGGVAVRAYVHTATAKVLKRSDEFLSRPEHRFDLEVEGNHTYLVDGVVVHNSPETTAGGRALKFYASVRLDIRRIATLKEGESAIGNRTRVKVVKNKVAAPFREAEFDILYNEGISREGELLDYAIEKNIVQKAGTWLSFGEERMGQGRENARLFLKEHADVRAAIEARLLPAMGMKAPGAATAEPAASAPAEKTGPAPGPPAARPGAAAPARPSPAMVASGERKR
jgi:recombination protein RecA